MELSRRYGAAGPHERSAPIWQNTRAIRPNRVAALRTNIRGFVPTLARADELVLEESRYLSDMPPSTDEAKRGEWIVETVRTLLAQKKFGEAGNRCDEILRRNPDDPAANHAKALVLAVRRRPEQAVSCLELAIKSRPNLIDAHNLLGSILASLGRFDEAETVLKKAIELDSSCLSPRITLADLLKKQNHLTRALDGYRQVLELDPNNARVHKRLAMTLRQAKEPKQAATSFARYLKLVPDDIEAMTDHAHALKESGELQAAMEGYLKVIMKDPERISALNGFAVSLQQSGQLDLAIANYRKILEIHSRKPTGERNEKRNRGESTVRCNLAVALRRAGRVSDARAMYESALKLNPENSSAWNNLGNTNKELGRNEEAAQCFRRALELDPQHNSAHSNLLFALNYYADQETIYQESVAWEAMHGSVAEISGDQRRSPKDSSREKIRVGYLSEDFKRHSVAYFLLPLLENHDRSRFEIYCYSDVALSLIHI